MKRLRILIGIAALVCVSPPGWAQNKAPPKTPTPAVGKKSLADELTGEAKEKFVEGNALMETNALSAAGVAFKRAYELSKNPRILASLAVAEAKGGNYLKAISYLEKEKLEGLGKLTPAQMQDVEQRITVFRSFTAKLEIVVKADARATRSTDGAKLMIKGETVGGAAPFHSPITVDSVSSNPYEVVLEKEGFREARATIQDLKPGESRTVVLTLEQSAREHVPVEVLVTGPESAKVTVDGKECGAATAVTPCKMDVELGVRHTILAAQDGFLPVTKTVEVSSRETSRVTLALVPEEARIAIDALPQDASIFIDGNPKGSGRWEGVLSKGGHQLRVSKPGYVEHNVEIQVTTKQNRTLQISLVQDRGKATIYAVLGTAAIVLAGGVAGYFIFRPSDTRT